jgi:peptidoglycan/xylan/chitin deacetylase (PgdA/CDA1 family)
MFGKNNRLVLSAAALAAFSFWSMATPALVPVHNNYALPRPQSLDNVSVQSKESDNSALAQPASEDRPASSQSSPSSTPPPESAINEWQGAPQQLTTNPAQIPVLTRIPTDKPVVFLGIDDGLVKSPDAKDWLLSHKLPFTLFLEDDLVKGDYDYFRDLQAAGMTIEDHTISHPDLTTLTLDQQKAEICGAADAMQAAFGSRPALFRPPYGSVDETTRQAAAECGMKAIINWHAKANGGSIQFQDGNTHFLPGDIVLMHFRPEFLQDMKAFTDQVAADGLQVGRLEDWIQ